MKSTTTKKYIALIIAGNFAIIALLGVYLIMTNLAKNTSFPPYQHQRVREAFVEQHVGTDIAWSQNIGGSLNDSAVAIFADSTVGSDNLHVFGNASSNDFDFDYAGGFLAILHDNGSTVDFVTVNADMRIVKVFQANDEYIILQDSGDDGNMVAVSRMSFDGDMLATWSTSDHLNIVAEDLLSNGDILSQAFVLIYSRHLELVGNELIAVSLDASLQQNYQPPMSSIYSPFGLDFLSSYYIGNQLILFANEGLNRHTNAIAIMVQVGGSPQLVRINDANGPNFEYQTLNAQPFSQGYVLMSIATTGANSGALYLLSLSFDCDFSGAFNTKLRGVSYAQIIPKANNFYIFAYNGQGGNMFDIQGSIVLSLNPISGFENWQNITSTIHTDFVKNQLILAGKTTRGIAIITLDNTFVTDSIAIGGMTDDQESNPTILYRDQTITLVSNTTSANIHNRDGDVIRNFGNSDVWIVRLREREIN